MPSGVATRTAPVMAKSVPQSIGVRLYSRSAGCQSASVKKGASPTWRRTGSDSATRNATIRSTTAPATAAQARSTHTRSRSLLERNKALLPNQVVDLVRRGQVEELLDQPLRRRLRDQVERARQG